VGVKGGTWGGGAENLVCLQRPGNRGSVKPKNTKYTQKKQKEEKKTLARDSKKCVIACKQDRKNASAAARKRGRKKLQTTGRKNRKKSLEPDLAKYKKMHKSWGKACKRALI